MTEAVSTVFNENITAYSCVKTIMSAKHCYIMGIDIPTTTIPVRPGRNLAIILEIAAMNNRQKKMGYNTAEEFNKRLMSQMGIEE